MGKERLEMAKVNRNYRFSFKKENEGIVGVGTLIVFIAMILVAAIAAAVIIKTAWSLKDQAETVGQEAAIEAAGPPQIISVVGDRAASGSASATVTASIQRLHILVTTFVPSSAINISEMKILFVTDTVNTEMSYAGGAQGFNNDFGAYHLTNNGTGDTEWQQQQLLDNDDIVRLEVNLTNIDIPPRLAPLNPGDEVTIKLIPQHGPVVSDHFKVPMNFGSKRYIDLTSY